VAPDVHVFHHDGVTVRMLCQIGTVLRSALRRSCVVGVQVQKFDDALRSARVLEAVHLDAIMRVTDAKILRLAHLQDQIHAALGNYAERLRFVELKRDKGTEPALWLDLVHTITMQPDAATYRLTAYRNDSTEIVQETPHLKDILDTSLRHMAHEVVRDMRNTSAARDPVEHNTIAGWSATTLVYVWLTGFVVGAAALALLFIYLKNIRF
jgi:hypothetical protein